MKKIKNQITILAIKKETEKAIDTITELLFLNKVDYSIINKVSIALEEVLINIVSYAYEDTGNIDIIYELTTDPKKELSVTIIDEGKEFDPLKKEDPNITGLIEERKIGGLGIYMTKQIMDEVAYLRKDNKRSSNNGRFRQT